jgi:hypothetical protein
MSFSERSVQVLCENILRVAREEGKFDNLPGAGKPIPDLDDAYDPDWWLQKKMKEDDLSDAFREYQRRVLSKQEPADETK